MTAPCAFPWRKVTRGGFVAIDITQLCWHHPVWSRAISGLVWKLASGSTQPGHRHGRREVLCTVGVSVFGDMCACVRIGLCEPHIAQAGCFLNPRLYPGVVCYNA